MTADLIIQLIGFGGVAAGLYAAIRSDLVRALITAEQAAKSADEAHGRIDLMLGERRHRA